MSDQAKFEPKELPMRSARDIGLMLEYLVARDPNHPDVSILRWVLQDHKAGVDARILEMEAAMQAERERYSAHIARLERELQIQDTELRRMKSEPDHK